MDKPVLYIHKSYDDVYMIAYILRHRNGDGTDSTGYEYLYQGTKQQCIDWRRTFLHQKKYNQLIRRVN